jgi:hypothetical protein
MRPIERTVVPPIFSSALGQDVGHGKDLAGPLVQQEMIAPERRFRKDANANFCSSDKARRCPPKGHLSHERKSLTLTTNRELE